MTHTIRRDILTAVPVAFREDGALDLDGSREILEYVAASGTTGGFVLGTTGEFASLSREERQALTVLSLEVLAGKRVVVHVGAPSLFQVCQLIEDARSAGAGAVAVLTPYYLPASETAVLEFYRGVSAVSQGLDVYAYLFEARTGVTVDPPLLARIAQLPHIIGAKLSGESLERVSAFRAAVPEDFELFTGADIDLAKAADHGAQGVVSGIASVFPRPFVELADALAARDSERVDRAQLAVNEVVEVVAGDPARMKLGLRLMGLNAGYARMALDTPGEEVELGLRAVISRHGPAAAR